MTWGTPVQSFVFLGLLVFELEPMYATSDRRTDRQTDITVAIAGAYCVARLKICRSLASLP